MFLEQPMKQFSINYEINYLALNLLVNCFKDFFQTQAFLEK